MSVKTQHPYGVVNFICQLGGWFWTTLTFTSVDYEEADWTPCVGGPHPIRWRLETRTKRLASPCKRAFSSSLPWTLSAPLALLGIHPLAFGLDLHSQLSCLSSLLAHTTDFGHINFHSYMKQFLIKKKKPSPPCLPPFSLHIWHTLFFHTSLYCALQILWTLFIWQIGGKCVAPLCQASLPAPSLPVEIIHFMSLSQVGHSCNIFNSFIIISLMMTCDRRPLM